MRSSWQVHLQRIPQRPARSIVFCTCGFASHLVCSMESKQELAASVTSGQRPISEAGWTARCRARRLENGWRWPPRRLARTTEYCATCAARTTHMRTCRGMGVVLIWCLLIVGEKGLLVIQRLGQVPTEPSVARKHARAQQGVRQCSLTHTGPSRGSARPDQIGELLLQNLRLCRVHTRVRDKERKLDCTNPE
jgi:hypothetical protein